MCKGRLLSGLDTEREKVGVPFHDKQHYPYVRELHVRNFTSNHDPVHGF
jgi:hypothetical protein